MVQGFSISDKNYICSNQILQGTTRTRMVEQKINLYIPHFRNHRTHTHCDYIRAIRRRTIIICFPRWSKIFEDTNLKIFATRCVLMQDTDIYYQEIEKGDLRYYKCGLFSDTRNAACYNLDLPQAYLYDRHNLHIGNGRFKNETHFIYLGTTLTSQNCMQEETKYGWNS
jgi:hypothetical protein